MLANMIAASLSVLCALVCIMPALCAPRLDDSNNMFVTSYMQGKAHMTGSRTEHKFRVGDGQCSAALDRSNMCGQQNSHPQLLKLTVLDSTDVKIVIKQDLSSAEIWRKPDYAGNCPGVAIVTSSTVC